MTFHAGMWGPWNVAAAAGKQSDEDSQNVSSMDRRHISTLDTNKNAHTHWLWKSVRRDVDCAEVLCDIQRRASERPGRETHTFVCTTSGGQTQETKSQMAVQPRMHTRQATTAISTDGRQAGRRARRRAARAARGALARARMQHTSPHAVTNSTPDSRRPPPGCTRNPHDEQHMGRRPCRPGTNTACGAAQEKKWSANTSRRSKQQTTHPTFKTHWPRCAPGSGLPNLATCICQNRPGQRRLARLEVSPGHEPTALQT